MAHGPIPDKPPRRCNVELAPDGEYPCALPEGHAGMHTPLPVLWQMAGFAKGPWDPDHTRELGDEIRDAAPECTCAEDREGGDLGDHSHVCAWANFMRAAGVQE